MSRCQCCGQPLPGAEQAAASFRATPRRERNVGAVGARDQPRDPSAVDWPQDHVSTIDFPPRETERYQDGSSADEAIVELYAFAQQRASMLGADFETDPVGWVVEAMARSISLTRALNALGIDATVLRRALRDISVDGVAGDVRRARWAGSSRPGMGLLRDVEDLAREFASKRRSDTVALQDFVAGLRELRDLHPACSVLDEAASGRLGAAHGLRARFEASRGASRDETQVVALRRPDQRDGARTILESRQPRVAERGAAVADRLETPPACNAKSAVDRLTSELSTLATALRDVVQRLSDLETSIERQKFEIKEAGRAAARSSGQASGPSDAQAGRHSSVEPGQTNGDRGVARASQQTSRRTRNRRRFKRTRNANLRRWAARLARSVRNAKRRDRTHAWRRSRRDDWRVRVARLAGASARSEANRLDTLPQRRFYLSLDDLVVDAPSIGPKTADRLLDANILTVRDLMLADPSRVAEQVAARHISAETIRDWQDQARLVMTIPFLRGTHAQLLVGAGYRSQEAITSVGSGELLAAVLRFSTTREGQRILRDGPPPAPDKVLAWLGHAKSAAPERAVA